MKRSLVVFVGGSIGAVARWGVGLALLPGPGGFPTSTFVVNMSGSFGLGFMAVLLIERMPPTRWLRPLIATGFFGAYTTFSTMAVEGVRLIDVGRVETAVVYWLLTLVVGQMAGVYGMWLARLQFRRERGSDR